MKTVLRILSLFIMVALMVGGVSVMSVSAETYITDNDFVFTRDSSGITIYNYVGKNSSVNIPTYLVGQSVVGVSDYAFMNNTVIQSISMPITISNLGRGAFYGCTSLISAQLPENCSTIGQYMFYECTSLKNVTLPNVLKEVPRYCFTRCVSLETVTLPSTAKVIGEYAFANCPELEDVYVSKYTNSISDTAFENSPKVVIHGYLNTYAYTYAMEHNIPFAAVDASAETFYVTFMNYDGSTFLSIPVAKGSSVQFPSKIPTKPSTDTHYYEFAYWDGNIVNIQKNEFVYPVFNEREIEPEVEETPATYTVVFLDSNDKFLGMQTVLEGEDATIPDYAPWKESTSEYNFEFIGWDQELTGITQHMVARPVYKELLREYRITFVDVTGENILSEQVIPYGGFATAPEVPYVEGYEFVCWDTDFGYVDCDMVVVPIYQEIYVPVEPRPLPTIGSVKIEVTGGTGFAISVNGESSRPQGSVYRNSKMPIGATVTVTANETADAEFAGWMNPVNGVILTTNPEYTFIASGNDSFNAVYNTDIENVQLVTFRHNRVGAYGRVLESQYYSTQDEILFPDDPTCVGYDFAGWSMTEEEIKAAIARGENVEVIPTWTIQQIYYEITVVGGTGSGSYLANVATTVTANEAPEGCKFAYWEDSYGRIRSYDKAYKLYPNEDITLTAVFVAEDEDVEKQILIGIDSVDTTSVDTKNTFYYSWYVPTSYDLVKTGIIAVAEESYNEETFYAGTSDANVYDRSPSGTVSYNKTAIWTKSNVTPGQTWYAKAYVQYRDTDGTIVTVYSEMVAATKY